MIKDEVLKELYEKLEKLDPAADDFAQRVAEIDQKISERHEEIKREKAEERRRQVLGAADQPVATSMIDAVWGQKDYHAQLDAGGAMAFSAPFPTAALATKQVLTPAGGELRVQVPDVVSFRRQTPRLRDVIGTIPLGPNERAVSYVRESSYTVSADTVGEGQPKPRSEISLEAVTETAKTIAHYVDVTRQALRSRAGMQRYIEGRLVDGLALVEDKKLLTGAGGSDVPGLLNDPGIQTYTRQGSENKIDAVLHAAMMVITASDGGAVANAVVLHPNDYEDMARLKDSNGQYIFPDFVRAALDRATYPLLGLRPVVTTAISAGTALVGAFGVGNALYESPQGVIRITESDQDKFIKNIVTVLGEYEIVHTIELPKAFVAVTL